MKICPKCSEHFPDDANFCPMDASKLAPKPAPVTAPAPTGPAMAGRYRLIERIETRSSGEIWRADDGQGHETRLMLVAPTVFPSPLVMERAQRELRQLQRVTTSTIVRVLDVGRLEDGRLYIATEPAAGGHTLREIVSRDGRLPLARACRLLVEVGEAVAEGQKVGVVHRDISADNVLIVGDKVKVTNFVVADPLTDQVFGNPAFLSPEQASGKPPDQRSNIYSLGALLYYLVAGQPPFEGDSRELLEKQRNEEAVPLSKRASKIPTQADALLQKAMAKSPGRRHLTLRQFLKEVTELGEANLPTGEVPKTASQESASAEADMVRAKTFAVLPNVVASSEAVAVVRPSASSSSPALAAKPLSADGATSSPSGRAVAAVASPPSASAISNAPAPGPLVAPPMGAAAASVAGTLGEGAAVVTAHEPQAASAQARPAPAAKAGFRETMWFFKGEVASLQAASGPATEDAPTSVLEDERPIDDKYKDDGSLEASGGAKLSLKTGRTQVMKAIKVPKPLASGDKMTEEEFLNEMGQKGRLRAYVVVGLLGVLGIGLLVWLVF